MSESEEKPLVVIRSLVYNHEPYLRDCLEGFVMQQTTFPFVAVVHDDCSTDGSAAIIREYAEKYPHIIKPVYETENQYSKGTLGRAMKEACGKYGAKYYALCEGDDYWTDPHKLQKQVDFLEAHPEYAMVCCNCEIHTPTEKYVSHEDHIKGGWAHCAEDREITPEETIERHGRYARTAGIMYHRRVLDMMPESTMNCEAGDFRLQLSAMLAGKIYHMNDNMFVYRFMVPGSWTAKNEGMLDSEKLLTSMQRLLDMLEVFNEKTHGRYETSFKIAEESMLSWRLHTQPQAAGIIKQHFGHLLWYKRLSSYHQSRHGWLTNMILKACYHPYYPLTSHNSLICPLLRPFYKTSAHKGTIHIGPFNIVSFVETSSGRTIYVCGKKVL